MGGMLAKGSKVQSGVFIAVTAFLLSLLGLVTVLSATLVRAMGEGRVLSEMFTKQCLFVAIATAAALAVSRIDYHRLVERSAPLLLLTWLGLVAVLVIGDDRNGARRWISLGAFGLQVSEVAKFVVVLACADYATRRRDVMASWRHGFLPAAAWLGITVLLIARQPDFGTSMFILGYGFILLWLGGMRLTHIIGTATVALPLFFLVMMEAFSHIADRLATLKSGPHEQVRLALCAMGGGGLFGRGIGEARAQLWFLPYVESDFIFAAVGEQYGLMGTLAIILLFVLFFWHGLKITLGAPDRAGFLVAFGLSFMIVFQAAINMAVVTGLVPPKGIGLPFVSYGGSSLLVLGCCVGTLLNVASQAESAGTGEEHMTHDEDAADGVLEERAWARTNEFEGG